MKYVTKKCPHCNTAYSVMQPKGTGLYGSPIRQCSRCHGTFIDKDYREIAVDGIRKVDTKKLSFFTIFASAGFIAMCVVAICLYSEGKGLISPERSIWTLVAAVVFFGIACYLIIDEIRGYNKRQELLAKEREQSEARLLNYQYACYLKRLGYKVPNKYLTNVPAQSVTIPSDNVQANSHVVESKNNNQINNTSIQTTTDSRGKTNSEIMFCNKCGNKLLERSSFCAYCGNKIPFTNSND